jgi:glutamate synthase (NADPH/NADH) small chain
VGKPTGFIEWPRRLPLRRPVGERLGDWREVETHAAPEATRQQAGRCMDCGIPFCQQGCPLGNPIPDFNDLVYKNRFAEAFAVLEATNNFPEFTGRLCPAPCEAACTLTINQAPVTIEHIEKEIAERAFEEGWVRARPPLRSTGKHVAVVGSGPAGLAAAQQLNRAGHRVTLYERADRLGGLLRYGIPDFKMEKWVLDRRLKLLEEEGIDMRPGVDVGVAPTWDELQRSHDALLIAVGSRRPRDLDVPGRDLVGVHFAMEFLEQQNRVGAGDALPVAERIDAKDKRVIILGGGDTGSDCLGTTHRQGAKSVAQIELLPEPPPLRRADNPWPQWPLVFRTSSSQEEGGERLFGMLTQSLEGKALEGERGRLAALNAVDVELDGGRIAARPGSERRIEVDLLLLAMGFVGPEATTIADQLGVALDSRGNIATENGYQSSVEGVFAAGDARRGQSLIVWAIIEGREAARAIDAHLRGSVSALPARGYDCAYGR